jgi:PEP-CTERM motif
MPCFRRQQLYKDGDVTVRASRQFSTLVGIAATALGIAVAAPAMAQNLVTNGTFAVTGGSTSFQFGPGQNPSVVNESLAGWTTTGGTNDVFIVGSPTAVQHVINNVTTTATLFSPTSNPPSANGFVNAPGNQNFIGTDTDLGTAPITQSISGLTVGATYAISFVWAGAEEVTGAPSPTEADWQVTFGSSTQSTTVRNVAAEGFASWINATLDFVATATTQTLSFLGQDPKDNPTGAGAGNEPAFALLANVQVAQVPEPTSMALLTVGALGVFGTARSRRARRQSIPAGAVLPS